MTQFGKIELLSKIYEKAETLVRLLPRDEGFHFLNGK